MIRSFSCHVTCLPGNRVRAAMLSDDRDAIAAPSVRGRWYLCSCGSPSLLSLGYRAGTLTLSKPSGWRFPMRRSDVVALVACVPMTPKESLPRPLPLRSLFCPSFPTATRLRWPLSGTLMLRTCRSVEPCAGFPRATLATPLSRLPLPIQSFFPRRLRLPLGSQQLHPRRGRQRVRLRRGRWRLLSRVA